MSTTDSESSIDWLASDNEEEEEEDRDTDRQHEPNCVVAMRPSGSPSSRRPPESDSSSSSSSSTSSSSGGGGESVLHHGRRSEAVKLDSCSGVRNAVGDSDAGRPRQAPQAQGGEARNPLKRPHGPLEGQGPRALSNQEDKEQQVFTSKCMALQCYIHPLSSILNGLRSGRHRERLSSFQESVAIDRIQRIMGVLQNPCMGEKYINIILKMEEMLKSWFPNVKPLDQRSVAQAEHDGPTKKLKLPSPVTTDLTSVPSLSTPGAPQALRVPDHSPPGAHSASSSSSSSLKWLHSAAICLPSSGLAPPLPPPPPPPPPPLLQQPQAQAGPRHLLHPAAPRDTELTQDSAVSSSTDRHAAKTDAAAAPLKAPPGKKVINAPCLERLLKSTESIVSRKARVVGNS